MSTQLTNDQIKAKKEFEVADKLASQANESAHAANIALKKYKEENDRLTNWKSIMATAPVVLFTIIFFIVSVGEYMVSKEIYREFNDNYPWLIAIVFFVAGVFISEFLVYKIFKQKRNWKRYELNRDPNNDSLTDDEKSNAVQKVTTNYFIFGVLLGTLLIGAIGFLSFKRVQGELAAGMRESGFGVMDLMPVLLYIIEIISGAFILYLIKQISLSFRVKSFLKKFNNNIQETNLNTGKAIKKYQDAEKLNFDPFHLTVSDNIHTVYHRNKVFTLDNKEEYVTVTPKMNDVFNILLVDKDKNPLSMDIAIITDYKYTAKGSTNREGRLSLEIEGTFPGDSVKQIFIRESANATKYETVKGDYDLDKKKVHQIILS